jgi:hypothetical protein
MPSLSIKDYAIYHNTAFITLVYRSISHDSDIKYYKLMYQNKETDSLHEIEKDVLYCVPKNDGTTIEDKTIKDLGKYSEISFEVSLLNNSKVINNCITMNLELLAVDYETDRIAWSKEITLISKELPTPQIKINKASITENKITVETTVTFKESSSNYIDMELFTYHLEIINSHNLAVEEIVTMPSSFTSKITFTTAKEYIEPTIILRAVIRHLDNSVAAEDTYLLTRYLERDPTPFRININNKVKKVQAVYIKRSGSWIKVKEFFIKSF